jgi:hypothetical protein
MPCCQYTRLLGLNASLNGRYANQVTILYHWATEKPHIYPPKVPLSLTSTLTTIGNTLRLFSVGFVETVFEIDDRRNYRPTDGDLSVHRAFSKS